MKHALIACMFVGCGASAQHAEVASPLVDDAGTDAVAIAPSEPTPVQRRLAPQTPFELPWETSLRDLTDAQRLAFAEYEAQRVSPEPIDRACGDGRFARVAIRTTPAGRADVLRNVRCDVTLGELVACELAVREQPCVLGGIGLPECLALDACDAVAHRRVVDFIIMCERVHCGSDR